MQTLCQRLNAGHGTNGNPRTLWLECDQNTGDLIAVHMEGYEGIPKRLYSSVHLPEIHVDFKEFKFWKGRSKNTDILFFE
jgi:hypothetical protein